MRKLFDEIQSQMLADLLPTEQALKTPILNGGLNVVRRITLQ